MPIAINQVVERVHCFDARRSASNSITSVGCALMANRFVAVLANADRWLVRMIEAVHFNGGRLTFTGPRRKPLFSKAAWPAVPCTLICFRNVPAQSILVSED